MLPVHVWRIRIVMKNGVWVLAVVSGSSKEHWLRESHVNSTRVTKNVIDVIAEQCFTDRRGNHGTSTGTRNTERHLCAASRQAVTMRLFFSAWRVFQPGVPYQSDNNHPISNLLSALSRIICWPFIISFTSKSKNPLGLLFKVVLLFVRHRLQSFCTHILHTPSAE